jgi:hypothetical protein
MAFAIAHEKVGKLFADCGNLDLVLVRLEPCDELVVSRLKIGKQLAGLAEIEFQALLEWRVEGFGLLKGLGKSRLNGFGFSQPILRTGRG